MKLVMIDGGLGNQVFQYIFYRYLQEAGESDVYIDDRFFSVHTSEYYTNEYKGYELKRVFGLTPSLLSEHFDKDVWQEILETTKSNNKLHFIDLMRANGIQLRVVSEANFIATYKELIAKAFPETPIQSYEGPFKSVVANAYHPDIVKLEGNVYYHGYWINGNYFKKIRDIIIEELAFPDFDDDKNKEMAEKLQREKSVVMHVRRGDFVKFGWAMDSTFYDYATIAIRLRMPKPNIYVFSDDLEWCRENRNLLGLTENVNAEFVEGNTGDNAFRDMQLMSLCKIMIISNSSFSYLAALLNKNPDKIVLNPTPRLIV